MRVLMVKTSSMGDVIHTLPALTDAKRAIPDLQVDWVVEEGFAQIPSWHVAVDRVIGGDPPLAQKFVEPTDPSRMACLSPAIASANL